MMQKAIEQYRVCQTLGTCLVPSAFGCLVVSRRQGTGWQDRPVRSAVAGLDLRAPLVYESGRLEVLDMKTGRVRVLAASGKTCAWSPDGRWIAFDRVPNRGPAGCASELWVVSSAGGQPRYLARGDWPNWVGRTGQLFYHSGGLAYSLNIDDPLGKPESILACDPYFAVSPDGKYLAHSEADRLSVVEISNGQMKARWTAPPPYGQHGMALRWSPNGKEVLAGGLHQGEMGLWSLDVEQGKAWQLFPSPVVLGHVSPDGSRMALELRDWYGGLWLAKLDPADSLHEAVRTARTEEQYLRQSCRDFAAAIRRGTYRKDAGTYLYAFITRRHACGSYYRRASITRLVDTFLGLDDSCDALGWQPRAPAAMATVSLQRLGQPRGREAGNAAPAPGMTSTYRRKPGLRRKAPGGGHWSRQTMALPGGARIDDAAPTPCDRSERESLAGRDAVVKVLYERAGHASTTAGTTARR
jgi:hypothetical protein